MNYTPCLITLVLKHNVSEIFFGNVTNQNKAFRWMLILVAFVLKLYFPPPGKKIKKFVKIM